MKTYNRSILISVTFLSVIFIIILLYNPSSSESHKIFEWNDIYNKYAKGSSIDSIFLQLPKANRFILTENYIITTVDLYEKKNPDHRACHLLFYGKDLKLECAHFVNTTFNSIVDNKIYIYYSDSVGYKGSQIRATNYRNDLPSGYSLENIVGTIRVDESYIRYDLQDVSMKNFPIIALAKGEHEYYEYLLENLVITPYPSLTYQNEGYIYATRRLNDRKFIRDRISITHKEILNKYYHELYAHFQKWGEE